MKLLVKLLLSLVLLIVLLLSLGYAVLRSHWGIAAACAGSVMRRLIIYQLHDFPMIGRIP